MASSSHTPAMETQIEPDKLLQELGCISQLSTCNLTGVISGIRSCSKLTKLVLEKLVMLCTNDAAASQTAPRVVEHVVNSYKSEKVAEDDMTVFFNELLAKFKLPPVDEQVNKVCRNKKKQYAVLSARIRRETLLITFTDQVVNAVSTNLLPNAEAWTISLCNQLLKTLVGPKIPLLKKAAILSVVARSLQENNLFKFEDGLESPEDLGDSLMSYFYDFVPLVVEKGDNDMVQTILKPLYVFLVYYKPALTKVGEKPSQVAENLKLVHDLWTEFCKRCYKFSQIADINRVPKEAHVSMYYLKEVSDFIVHILSTTQRGTGKRKPEDLVPRRAGLRARKS